MEVKMRERVDEKGQKKCLGRRSMDCSTGEGGKVKRGRIGKENSDGEVNNTGIIKKPNIKKHQV
jgi:hypothetical protein